MNIKSEFKLDINGSTIAGINYGIKGNPIILALHGWLDNCASFEMLAQHLPDHYIIAIDFIGHGQSSHRSSSQPYYIWDNVTDVALILKALNLTKVDLLGHSMGAGIAMLFAACFPEKVGQLFLIEGVAPLDYKADQLPKLMAQGIESRIESFNKKLNKGKDFELLVKARMYSRFPVSEEAAKQLVKRGTKEGVNGFVWSSDVALTLPSIQRMSQEQILAFIQNVTCKVSVFLGDSGLSTESWHDYINWFKDQDTIVFPGNHHLHMQPSGVECIAERIRSSFEN